LAVYACPRVDDGWRFVDGIAGLRGSGCNFLFLSGTNLWLAPVSLAMAGYHLCVHAIRAWVHCSIDTV
jgi:hypothetical protein